MFCEEEIDLRGCYPPRPWSLKITPSYLDLHDFTDHTHPYPIIPSYFDKIKDRIIVIV